MERVSVRLPHKKSPPPKGAGFPILDLAGPEGFEPPTYRLEGGCSVP